MVPHLTFMKKCTITMYNTIGAGRLGYMAWKGGRRGVLYTSQYLGSLSTDSKPGKRGCLTVLSQTNIFPPVTFKTGGILCCLLFIKHILCGWVMGIARNFFFLGGGVLKLELFPGVALPRQYVLLAPDKFHQ
jgi:hypothetical protein